MSDEERDQALRERIHLGMPVLGMDGDALGRVFDVGEHALALERGNFFPREWTASFIEVAGVNDRGVWLRHGRGSLERVQGAFAGPAEWYREAAAASPIHQWAGFDPPAVAQGPAGHPPPSDWLPTSPERAEPPPVRADDADTPGESPPTVH